MMSTAARYSIKPKTLSLLELSQSIGDFRQPPPSVTSYQYQSSPNTAQILTRRLYLHPLTINPNGKQQLAKLAPMSNTSPENEQDHPPNSDKHHTKGKSSHRALAVRSISFPLTARTNPKPYTRPLRDKFSAHTYNDTKSDDDASSTTASFNQSSLPFIARGTFSSTHTICTRPACVRNHRKTYTKPMRSRPQRINVWHHLDQTLQRPIPLDPPTTPLHPRTTRSPGLSTISHRPSITPLSNGSHFNIENKEPRDHHFNYSSIQEIQIYKRNPREKSFINDDHDYDDYIYMKE